MRSEESASCPYCSDGFKIIGSRVRMFYDAACNVKTLVIRRLRCRGCLKVHHELPHILIPYKRHCAETIEKILSESASQSVDVPVEESTIRRIKAWWKVLLPYLLHILNGLTIKHNVTFDAGGSPRKIVRSAANSGFYPHTRSAFSPG